MIGELENPFSVTKATEFSDVEINEYWVNYNIKEKVSFESMLNPKEYLPKYLIGGKGCGKTHILRYFSYPVQKIRNSSVINTLNTDKYVGIYSVFHGINSTRFSGKGIDESAWSSVFEYYFELYICDSLLVIIQDIFRSLQLTQGLEATLVDSILHLFGNYKDIKEISNLDELIGHISELRRKIDSEVLNAAFTRQLKYEDIKVLFSPGDLLFGIPIIANKQIAELQEVKFIYILDEYEKLYEWQKKFVNTLVWDKKMPVTFWIGARRYGYTTRDTKSGQEMKSGSEFQDVSLDDIIRSNEALYKNFAEKLYVNRLVKFYESKNLIVDPDLIRISFCKKFEEYSDAKIIDDIIVKNRNKEYKHIKELKLNLVKAYELGLVLPLSEENVKSIVENLISNTSNNPLEQKYTIYYFYRLWNKIPKNKSVLELSKDVHIEYLKFKGGEPSVFNEILDKRKKDFIAQLAKENNVKNTEYSGIQEFIRISQGNARTFILILKKVIEFAKIKGERPLEDGGRISLESQYLAVYETARWFYEDAEVVGEDGKNLYSALKRLSDYFILERFCDKPVETTVSCFNVKCEELSNNAVSCIELMKVHSLIVEDTDGRIEKNSGRKERMFHINKILAPLWNLPTVVRGSIPLNKELSEAIFDSQHAVEFDALYRKRKAQLNAPDFGKKDSSNNEAQTLFNPKN